MDHFCVRLESFQEQAIHEYLVYHGVSGSKLETRSGAEGKGPSIYIQDPKETPLNQKPHPLKKAVTQKHFLHVSRGSARYRCLPV